MLQSRILILFSWKTVFELIQPSTTQEHTVPSCIRIIGDVNGDSTINKWIDQDFTYDIEDMDPSLWSKYISEDGEYQFGFEQEQWFLMAISTVDNKFLQSPAPILNDQLDLLNPLVIVNHGWKRWVSNDEWELVTNPIYVKICEQSTQLESSATPIPSITTQPATPMTKTSIPECIEIKTNLTFFLNNNDDQCEMESILKVRL